MQNKLIEIKSPSIYFLEADTISYNFYLTVSEWEQTRVLCKDIYVSQLPISKTFMSPSSLSHMTEAISSAQHDGERADGTDDSGGEMRTNVSLDWGA